MRIAYLINQYPKISHSFIRREIGQLERLGFDVDRIAIRGWDDEALDELDAAERRLTRYVLRDGTQALLASCFRILLRRPVRFARALHLAWTMSRRGRAAIDRASDLPGRGVPDLAMDRDQPRGASSRPFRNQSGRSRDAGPHARRAAMELHRAWTGGIRQGAADPHGGKAAAVCVRGPDQLVWTKSVIPYARSGGLAKGPCRPLRTRCVLLRQSTAVSRCLSAVGVCRATVRAKGPASPAGSGTGIGGTRNPIPACDRRRRRDAARRGRIHRPAWPARAGAGHGLAVQCRRRRANPCRPRTGPSELRRGATGCFDGSNGSRGAR